MNACNTRRLWDPSKSPSPAQMGYELLPGSERLRMCSYPLLRFPATVMLAKRLGAQLGILVRLGDRPCLPPLMKS